MGPPAPLDWRLGLYAKARRADLFLKGAKVLAKDRRVLEIVSRRNGNMSELIFLVEESPDGGFTARALGESIFTEAESLDELRVSVREAARCHFDEGKGPKVIRLHYVREEVFAA